MHGSGLDYLELLFLALLVTVAALALVAKRLRVAYPIMVVLGGLLLSFIPHVPSITMDPNVVFLVILPPLVFSAAFHTSWRDFRNNLSVIIMLAFGLVGFTVFGVAGTMHVLVPGFSWKLGLVLGSLVAATDAIAATATAKRLGLPRRITDLLEAESLVNDGSGLVAFKFTLAMVVTGVTPSVVKGAGTLVYLCLAAVVVGLVIGFIVHHVQERINDAPVEITISLVTPYLAYLAAENLQCSGVLATLACGLYLGRRSSGFYSLHARIEASAVWRTLDFVLNGLVFLVLGLQLPYILNDIRGISARSVIVDGALFSLAVVLLRFMWVYPAEWISSRIQRWRGKKVHHAAKGEVFLLGWAGMRGVLALAAAFSLPERLSNGSPFPYRNLIIFLTFCVIFATLVLQGLTMPFIIRLLGLAKGTTGYEEENAARQQMISAALRALNKIRKEEPEDQRELLDYLESFYRQRLALIDHDGHHQSENDSLGDKLGPQRYIAQELRDVERSVALELRNQNKIHDEVLRRLEHELDLLDARFSESD